MAIQKAVNKANGSPAAGRHAAPPPPPSDEGINLGSRDFYGGGDFVIPEGRYTWKSLDVVMWAPPNSQRGEVLGVQITLAPEEDPEKEVTSFYSMGSKAGDSFQPNPQTGKGISRIPGTSGGKLNDLTNWFALIQSLWNAGMPEDYFSNDTTVFEGMDVRMTHIEESQERKNLRGIQAEPSMIPGAAPQQSRKIAVVLEIYNAPWEAKKAAPRAAAKPIPMKKPVAAPPPPTEETDDEQIATAASAAIASILEKSPNGIARLALRNATHAYVLEHYDQETADAVITDLVDDTAHLNTVLGPQGYKVQGPKIVQA